MAGRRRRKAITSLAEGLAPFVDLMRAFVAESISAEEFETEFYRVYASTDQRTDFDVTSAITTFYIEVDSLVIDPQQRIDDDDALAPEELRKRAAALLEEAGLLKLPPA